MTIDMPAPLGGPPPAEIPLSRSPLARVIAQARFATVLSIESKPRIAPLQDELRGQYPVFRQDTGQNLQVELTPAGPTFQTNATTLWRFSDLAGEWTVTLAVDAVTLETRRYTSRADFLARLSSVLSAMERAFAPGFAERLGMRYVTRVTGEGYERVDRMVGPGLLGVAIPSLRENVRHAISEAVLSVEEGDLSMRWGVMPPNGTFDASVLEAVDASSWVLDIDVSSSGAAPFEAVALSERFEGLAGRAYAMFRYMVTDDFIALHGGSQ